MNPSAEVLNETLGELEDCAELQMQYVLYELEGEEEFKNQAQKYAEFMDEAEIQAKNAISDLMNGVEGIERENELADAELVSITPQTLQKLQRYRFERRRFDALSDIMEKNDKFDTSPRDERSYEDMSCWGLEDRIPSGAEPNDPVGYAIKYFEEIVSSEDDYVV